MILINELKRMYIYILIKAVQNLLVYFFFSKINFSLCVKLNSKIIKDIFLR
jgi:hypothetical protein